MIKIGCTLYFIRSHLIWVLIIHTVVLLLLKYLVDDMIFLLRNIICIVWIGHIIIFKIIRQMLIVHIHLLLRKTLMNWMRSIHVDSNIVLYYCICLNIRENWLWIHSILYIEALWKYFSRIIIISRHWSLTHFTWKTAFRIILSMNFLWAHKRIGEARPFPSVSTRNIRI